jgi:anti-sigma factor (TIGR02949 family)
MGDDCDQLLHQLADLLHGDVDDEQRAALQHHLESCPPCFERADFQAQLRRLIATRCSEPVPDELRARVLSVLAVEVTDSAGPGGPS